MKTKKPSNDTLVVSKDALIEQMFSKLDLLKDKKFMRHMKDLYQEGYKNGQSDALNFFAPTTMRDKKKIARLKKQMRLNGGDIIETPTDFSFGWLGVGKGYCFLVERPDGSALVFASGDI